MGGVTALESRYWALLRSLENFYGDSVQAQKFDGTSTSTKEHKVLLRPAESNALLDEWRYLWRTARHDDDRERVIEDMEKEDADLRRSPSLKYRFVHGTLEWKVAIGTCDLAPKETARLYGVGVSTVYKYRKNYRQVA